MAKIITAPELAEIIKQLLTTEEIDNAETFRGFMGEMASLVADYCGGDVSTISGPGEPSVDDGTGWTVAIHHNDSVPDDGGVWKDYDTEADFGPPVPRL